jgi:hypothetical protein
MRIYKVSAVFFILCILQFEIQAQKIKYRYQPNPYNVSVKLGPLINPYAFGLKLGLEVSDASFDDYYVEASYFVSNFFFTGPEHTHKRLELGYHKALGRKSPYPYFLNTSLLLTQETMNSKIEFYNEQQEFLEYDEKFKRAGLGIGFGKKLRIIGNFRYEVTLGARLFLEQRNYVSYYYYTYNEVENYTKYRFLLHPLVAMKYTFSY